MQRPPAKHMLHVLTALPRRAQVPNDKVDLLEDLIQKLQSRQMRLNRQEFLQKVRPTVGRASRWPCARGME